MRKLPDKPKFELPPPTNQNYISPYYSQELTRARSSKESSIFEKYYAHKKHLLQLQKQRQSAKQQHPSSSLHHKQLSQQNNLIKNETDNNNNNINNIYHTDINTIITESPYNKQHKQKLKSPLPLSTEQGLILPKIKHNYLYENRKLITKLPKKKHNHSPSTTDVGGGCATPFHKNYGKTPSYISKFKDEEKQKQAYLSYIKQQKQFPPGTHLLPEHERQETLNRLIERKQHLQSLLEKFPITYRSPTIQSQRESLYKQLDDIDKSIVTFSSKRVFIYDTPHTLA